jgi:hypothetical protein
MSWWQPGCEGDVPTKRSGHSLVLAMDGIKSHVLVFGGLQHSKKGSGPSNELFSLDINDPARFKWTKVDAGGNKMPPARWKHSACMDTDGNRMIGVCLVFWCVCSLSCLVLSLSCLVLSCLVLSCPCLVLVLPLSCLVLSILVMSCLVLSSFVLSCDVSCLVFLSCLVWSGLV